MENTYPLLNVGGKAKLGNYASIPGTGPACEICLHCSHLAVVKKTPTCGKFQQLTGKKGKPIETGTAACRYFDRRSAFNSTKGN